MQHTIPIHFMHNYTIPGTNHIGIHLQVIYGSYTIHMQHTISFMIHMQLIYISHTICIQYTIHIEFMYN